VNRIHQYRNGRQIFTDLIARDAEHMIETLDIEIQELIQMINQALQSISISYCHNVPYIHVNDIRNSTGQLRRVITIRYKNFSHDVKKRRVKKDATAATYTGVDNAMNELTMGAPIPQDDNQVEELQEEPQPHYDSDSDQSVASDVQAAIVASLQDA
jgi:hypothetical protein